MRHTQLSGGCLVRGASRPLVLAAFPWLASRHLSCRGVRTSAEVVHGDDRTQPLSLEHVLSQLRKAQFTEKVDPSLEAAVSGRGKHLGIAVSWRLRWTAAGCFTEEIRGPQLTFKWGYDGQKDSGCWEVDSSGLVRVMECDDHEAVLMTTYIRTGCWLQPHLQDRFDMELLPAPVVVTSGIGSSNSNSSGGSSSSSSGSSDAGGSRNGGVAGHQGEADSRPSTSAPSAAASNPVRGGAAGVRKPLTHGPARHSQGTVPAADEVIAISLRVRGRKLRVRVLVRRRDWRLLGFDHRMCADVETWELGDWKEWAPGVQYPTSAVHKASNGGQHAYLTNEGTAERCGGSDLQQEAVSLSGAAAAVAAAARRPWPTSFGLPLLPPIPADTNYAFQGGQQLVPLWRAASGHYLVRPSINGQEGGGYFVLDTGASGFVITPQAAARLGGQSFGETHAASISGKVPARFVRLGGWALGGLAIRQPVLMVMELEGLVRGAPGEVVGIVGHDLFRRAVMELPQLVGTAEGHNRGDKPRLAPAGSESGSESGSDDENGAGGWAPAASSAAHRAATAPSAAATAPSAPGGRSSTATSSGPRMHGPRSTPAFGPGGHAGPGGAAANADAASGEGGTSHGNGGGQPCGAALGQPVSAVAAVPSPRVVFEPVPPVGPSDSAASPAPASAVGSNTHPDCSDAASPSTTGRSSSSGSGSSGSGRKSVGRSVTARAVRRAARTVPYTLHEMVLHHPLEYEQESDWVWHPLVMIANLPHVDLRFADPAGVVRSALLMVDSGACGADIMLHARAQKELELGPAGGDGGGGARTQGHYLRGVGQDPKDFVQLQVLDLPWLELAGVRFEQVRCMCAAVGGLDISIYSHGILCGDLLARLEWAIDYTHKQIGFRKGAFAPSLTG